MAMDDETTVIGESVRVRGNLQGDEDLHVLGRIEGSIELDRTLLVADSGIVKAEVKVRNAVIAGVVVGNIHATESVELTEKGRMVGDISAPRVIIVDGASFRGAVDMGDIENMPTRSASSERILPRPLSRTGASQPDRASEDSAVAEKPSKNEPVEEVRDEVSQSKPGEKSTVTKPESESPPKTSGKKKPSFLNPPKARALPKKGKKARVVVKRK